MGNLVLTSDARQLIDRIRQDYGEVVLYQNSGCVCDDAPQCFSRRTFLPGSNDYRLETYDGSVCLWRSAKLDRGAPLKKSWWALRQAVAAALPWKICMKDCSWCNLTTPEMDGASSLGMELLVHRASRDEVVFGGETRQQRAPSSFAETQAAIHPAPALSLGMLAFWPC